MHSIPCANSGWPKPEMLTILPVVTALQDRHGVADMVVVADAGMRLVVGGTHAEAPCARLQRDCTGACLACRLAKPTFRSPSSCHRRVQRRHAPAVLLPWIAAIIPRVCSTMREASLSHALLAASPGSCSRISPRRRPRTPRPAAARGPRLVPRHLVGSRTLQGCDAPSSAWTRVRFPSDPSQ